MLTHRPADDSPDVLADPTARGKTGLAAVAVAALAVACCAGGPLLVAVAGSLAVAALIGIGAAVTVLVAVCAAVYVRYRPAAKRPRSGP